MLGETKIRAESFALVYLAMAVDVGAVLHSNAFAETCNFLACLYDFRKAALSRRIMVKLLCYTVATIIPQAFIRKSIAASFCQCSVAYGLGAIVLPAWRRWLTVYAPLVACVIVLFANANGPSTIPPPIHATIWDCHTETRRVREAGVRVCVDSMAREVRPFVVKAVVLLYNTLR